jgi:GTP-binding protein EngB required for normal cell division
MHTPEEGSNPDTAQARESYGRFRVLIIGRSNAGKTTILQKICKTTKSPVVYDRNGKKVGVTKNIAGQRSYA